MPVTDYIYRMTYGSAFVALTVHYEHDLDDGAKAPYWTVDTDKFQSRKYHDYEQAERAYKRIETAFVKRHGL